MAAISRGEIIAAIAELEKRLLERRFILVPSELYDRLTELGHKPGPSYVRHDYVDIPVVGGAHEEVQPS